MRKQACAEMEDVQLILINRENSFISKNVTAVRGRKTESVLSLHIKLC